MPGTAELTLRVMLISFGVDSDKMTQEPPDTNLAMITCCMWKLGVIFSSDQLATYSRFWERCVLLRWRHLESGRRISSIFKMNSMACLFNWSAGPIMSGIILSHIISFYY